MDLATSEIYTLSLHDALPISIPDAERQSQQRPSWKSLVEPEATALPGRPTVELGSVPRVRQTQEPLRASSAVTANWPEWFWRRFRNSSLARWTSRSEWPCRAA